MLIIKDLKKSYGQIKAVDGINLTIAQGEIVGLLGPNGAGKSTTISMIATLFKPDSGTIEFKGQDSIKNPKAIQKVLGVVPQEIALYTSLSGYENLKFWGGAYGLRGKKLKERIEAVSEIIGIKDRLKDKVEKYSGGMKRRINIGVALLHQPEILIMDEPTVGIDPQSRNHILETIKTLNKEGTTIIYTSHYMEEVEFLCDRIYIMDEGNVVASGTKDALVELIQNEKKITVEYEGVTAQLLEALEQLPSIKKVTHEENKVSLLAESDENLIKEIIDISTSVNIDILAIEVEKPNLESVFLKLTGKALRD